MDTIMIENRSGNQTRRKPAAECFSQADRMETYFFLQGRKKPETLIADDVVCMVRVFLRNEEYPIVGSLLSHLAERSLGNKILEMIFMEARKKMADLQFVNAMQLYDLIVKSDLFTLRNREEALVRRYRIQKKHFECTSENLYKVIEEYWARFPEGFYGDDMGSEAVTLLLDIQRYKDAAVELRRFLRRYPTSSHAESFRFLFAQTLRENLACLHDALIEYKKYITIYPQGKNGEEALYWIVKLSKAQNNSSSAAHYGMMYLQNYPLGRWEEEIRELAVKPQASPLCAPPC